MPQSDIRREETTINELQQKARYLKALLDCSADIIITGDTQGRITEFNKAAERLWGYKKKEVIGKPIESLYFYPYDHKKLMELLQKRSVVMDYEIRMRDKAGRLFDLSTSLAYLRGPKGKIMGTVRIAHDNRPRMLLQKQLVKMTFTDGLTKLYDRGYFNSRINQSVGEATNRDHSLHLIMIDLDGFKKYNDKYGHLEGDRILQRVGAITLRSIRSRVDSAYRYGGDEFAILIPGGNQGLARRTAEKLRRAIAREFAPHIKASIGVTKLQPGQDVYNFIKSADEAMYKAKSSGGNRLWIAK